MNDSSPSRRTSLSTAYRRGHPMRSSYATCRPSCCVLSPHIHDSATVWYDYREVLFSAESTMISRRVLFQALRLHAPDLWESSLERLEAVARVDVVPPPRDVGILLERFLRTALRGLLAIRSVVNVRKSELITSHVLAVRKNLVICLQGRVDRLNVALDGLLIRCQAAHTVGDEAVSAENILGSDDLERLTART